MHAVIAIVTDFLFAGKIAGTAQKLGAECRVVKSPAALHDALASNDPATVLVDMNCEGIPPAEAIRSVKSAYPNARVVAFFSHVQTDLKEQAEAAGADDVLPCSVFVRALPTLLGPSPEASQ